MALDCAAWSLAEREAHPHLDPVGLVEAVIHAFEPRLLQQPPGQASAAEASRRVRELVAEVDELVSSAFQSGTLETLVR